MLKHLLVILSCTLSPGVCDFPCHLFCYSIPGTECDNSFQAISLISLMTLGISSLVALFHRSHSEGWNLLDGLAASLIISGNQLQSAQQGMTMISSPAYFTSIPRTCWIRFRGGKAYLWPTFHFTFSNLLLKLFVSERLMLKYQEQLEDTHPASGRQKSLGSIPQLPSHWTGCLALRFATAQRYFGHIVTPSWWQLRKMSLTRPFSSLQWLPSSIHR